MKNKPPNPTRQRGTPRRSRDWSPADRSFPLIRDFRLLYWSDLSLRKAKTYAPHVHPHHQLTLIGSGHCRVMVKDTWFDARSGHCFYIPAGTRHGFEVEKSGDDFRAIQFRFQVPDEALPHLQIPPRVDLRHHDAIVALAEDARNNMESRNSVDLMLGHLQVMSLLLELSRGFGEKHESNGAGGRTGMEKALALIHSRFADSITVSMLASASGLSGSQFSRLFSQALGVAPMAYLRDVRLNRARELLESSAQTINDIATAVGYASHHYFSRDFRANVGLSPTEFRNRTSAG